jgi:hypothetical protein
MIDRLRMPRLAAADVIVTTTWPVIYRTGSIRVSGSSSCGTPRGAQDGRLQPRRQAGARTRTPVHKNYTHAIVSSEHDVLFYAEVWHPRVAGRPPGSRGWTGFFDEAARPPPEAAWPADRRAADDPVRADVPGRRPADGHTTSPGRLRRAASAVRRADAVIIRMHPFVTESGPSQRRSRPAPRWVHHPADATTVVPWTRSSPTTADRPSTDRAMMFTLRPGGGHDGDLRAVRDVARPDVRTPRAARRDRARHYELEKCTPSRRATSPHLDGGSTDRVIDQDPAAAAPSDH